MKINYPHIHYKLLQYLNGSIAIIIQPHTQAADINAGIGLMSRVFANSQGSITSRVIPKTQKMVPDTALLSIQHYKVRINGNVERSREWSSALSYTSV